MSSLLYDFRMTVIQFIARWLCILLIVKSSVLCIYSMVFVLRLPGKCNALALPFHTNDMYLTFWNRTWIHQMDLEGIPVDLELMESEWVLFSMFHRCVRACKLL
jgi:hypothetical protein